MKILIVNTFYYPIQVGGAELSVQMLAEGFVREGHTVTVLTLSQEAVGGRQEMNGVTVIRVPSYNRHIPLTHQGSMTERALWHLVDIFKGGHAEKHVVISEFDVICTNNLLGFSTQLWKTIKRQKRNDAVLVHCIRDFYLRCQRSSRYRQGNICQRTCTACVPAEVTRRRHSDCVDAVVGVSDYMLQHHLKADFFSNAASRTAIHNRPGDHLKFPRQSRAVGDPIRVGYMGRVAEHKGIFRLVQAFRKLQRRDMTLDIAGVGRDADLERLNTISEGDDRITCLGRTRPGDFYPRMDLVVVPSIWAEPLSRVVVESLFNGIPVFACDLGGPPEIVQHEVDGLVFPPTIQNIHSALENLTPEQLASMTANARARSSDMWADVWVRRYLDLFEKLLVRRSGLASMHNKAPGDDKMVGLG